MVFNLKHRSTVKFTSSDPAAESLSEAVVSQIADAYSDVVDAEISALVEANCTACT